MASKGAFAVDVYWSRLERDSSERSEPDYRRPGPFSMEIYSLILIKHFGSLGSHSSSPRISPPSFRTNPARFVVSRISSFHVVEKYNSNFTSIGREEFNLSSEITLFFDKIFHEKKVHRIHRWIRYKLSLHPLKTLSLSRKKLHPSMISSSPSSP